MEGEELRSRDGDLGSGIFMLLVWLGDRGGFVVMRRDGGVGIWHCTV